MAGNDAKRRDCVMESPVSHGREFGFGETNSGNLKQKRGDQTQLLPVLGMKPSWREARLREGREQLGAMAKTCNQW